MSRQSSRCSYASNSASKNLADTIESLSGSLAVAKRWKRFSRARYTPLRNENTVRFLRRNGNWKSLAALRCSTAILALAPELVRLLHCSKSISFFVDSYTKSLISMTRRHACVSYPSTTMGSYTHPACLRYRFSMAVSSRCNSSFCSAVLLVWSMYRKRSAHEPSRMSMSSASSHDELCSCLTPRRACMALKTRRLA